MFDPTPQRPKDINGLFFLLFIGAVLVADYLILSGKPPFGA